MKLIVKCLLICACFIAAHGINWKTTFEPSYGLKNCKFYESAEHEYKDYFELDSVEGSQPQGYLVKFEVYAIGYKNPHISFSTKPFPNINDKIYEFVIGHIYLGKTVTIIRNQRISGDMIMEETPNILKPFAPNRIIVSITDDGLITVVVNNVTAAVIRDPQPLPIKYFSLRSFESYNVQYFYGCDNDTAKIECSSTTEMPSFDLRNSID